MPLKLSTDPGIVFMGTPSFAVPSLEGLVGAAYRVLAVVTQPDRPKGRGRGVKPPPVKESATRLGLKVLQPEETANPSFIETVRAMRPELLIVVAFGQILKPALLECATCGALNIHASLLPKFRGPAPIQWAILKGEEKTGLTAMLMEEGLDTGPILLQHEVEIGDEESFGELQDRLARLSAPFLLETLDGLKRGILAQEVQDESRASYAPKLSKETAKLDWRLPAPRISALIRALDPYPGALTSFAGEVIKVFSCRIWTLGESCVPPGGILRIGREGMIVATGQGSILLRSIQAPGKKRVAAFEYASRVGLSVGCTLGD